MFGLVIPSTCHDIRRFRRSLTRTMLNCAYAILNRTSFAYCNDSVQNQHLELCAFCNIQRSRFLNDMLVKLVYRATLLARQ
ncbi:uncharacterized protein PHALS_14887 [Plasmopara halstedii]|uniref:Uncharacterized protein n=1 Tax=Plasmopara halstedii TaxID=4781 RepID=A0A0N7L773_PLAHL|nr:uncharacterized protein PHALS_14887 [Plasmopara halstedii]CEG46275.1 hypothetical protein PHALS_14887 [Plasmopara halstedii]|eukprot:XP_024582644.1 hypothetical protein PHALS_14887 [Plasmopara halstedii]